MLTWRSRLLAVGEVVAVFVLLRIGLVLWLIPRLGLGTQARHFVIYAAFMALPLLLLALRHDDAGAYGLSLRDAATQARTALLLFVPFALMGLWEGFLLPYLLPGAGARWPRHLLTAPAWLSVLLWSARLFGRQQGTASGRPGAVRPPQAGGAAPLAAVLPLIGTLALGQQAAGFVYYLCFVGPGEEILFRGYMQSRLNQVFGRPYRLLGATWGWGLVIATLLFGLMHAFNGFDPSLGQYQLDWAWAAGATVAGLVFAYLRERTGSVIAPAILHGLPQAIAALFITF